MYTIGVVVSSWWDYFLIQVNFTEYKLLYSDLNLSDFISYGSLKISPAFIWIKALYYLGNKPLWMHHGMVCWIIYAVFGLEYGRDVND